MAVWKPRAVVAHNVAYMRAILNFLVFRKLENNALNWKAIAFGGSQGCVKAEFGLIHGIGHEIDTEQRGDTQPCGKLDGFCPANLIEAVAIVLINLCKEVGHRFVIRPTRQGFLGKDLFGLRVDNGLESHGEVEV